MQGEDLPLKMHESMINILIQFSFIYIGSNHILQGLYGLYSLYNVQNTHINFQKS